MPRNHVRLFSEDGKLIRWVSATEAKLMVDQALGDEVGKRVPGGNPGGVRLTSHACRSSEAVVLPNHTLEIRNSERAPIVKSKLASAVILKRYSCCEICGFSRFVEAAHIIPDCLGGPAEDWNFLGLCPNCHSLFDRFQLSLEEVGKIMPRIRVAIVRTRCDDRLIGWRGTFLNKYGVIL